MATIELNEEELRLIHSGLIRLEGSVEIDINRSREDYEKTGKEWHKEFNKEAIATMAKVKKLDDKIKVKWEEKHLV